jgi:hypothetical protein
MTIEEHAEAIHRAISRAGFLMVTQLVHKKLRRSDLVEVVEKVEFAVAETKRLLDNLKPPHKKD